MRRILLSVYAVALLSACGGGGGGGTSESANTSVKTIKSVATYSSNTFSSILSLSPSAESIPTNAVGGLFSSTYSFTNGTVSLTVSAPASSSLPIIGYDQIVPVLSSPEFSRFTTGGAAIWPRARFGLYSTARVTNSATNTVTFYDMPYAAVNVVPTSVGVGGNYNHADGRALGILASNASFPWLRCLATGGLTVTGSTRRVTVTLSGCKDTYDGTGMPSGNSISVTNPTFTLTTNDNVTFLVSGNPTFSFGAGPTVFSPTTIRGDFQLAGAVSATEIVGRIYMLDNNGVQGAFAFGVKQ